jgi:hypothetical protein
MAHATEHQAFDASSNDEKILGDGLKEETTNDVGAVDNIPDPDAGLSAEERAIQVCNITCCLVILSSNH